MLFSDGRDTDDDSYCNICVLSPERLERSRADDTTGSSLSYSLRNTQGVINLLHEMKITSRLLIRSKPTIS